MAERGQTTPFSRSVYGVIVAFALALLALAAPTAQAELPSAPNSSDWVTDGPVYAVAHVLGRTFIGGDFRHIGPRSGLAAPIGSDGRMIAPFPEVAGGEVDAIASDNAGGWYIGGDFNYVGGVARNRLAHIDSSGAVDGWNPGANGPVRAMVLSQAGEMDEGTLYVGGDFTSIAGDNRPHAAAFNTSTGAVLKTWKPDPSDSVYAMAETYVALNEGASPNTVVKNEPVVFVGGPISLTTVALPSGTQPVKGLAAIWGIGAHAPDGTTTLSGIAVAGSPPTSFDGSVRALAAGPVSYDTTNAKADVPLYVGGEFSAPAKGLGAYQFNLPTKDVATATNRGNAGWSQYSNWSAAANCPTTPPVSPCSAVVRSLALSGSFLYAGGDFGQLGSAPAQQQRLAQITAIPDPKVTSGTATATVTAWPNAYPDKTVRSLAVSGGTLYLGGDFTSVGGAARNHLAAVDTGTGTVSTWDPEAAGGTAKVLAAAGSTIYAGGTFTSLGAVPAANLAALDATGAYDPAWKAGADDGPVHAFAVSPDGSTLYVGGGFTKMSDGTAAGQDRAHIAALSSADGSIQPWNPTADGWVLALADSGGTVYVGGSFTNIGGVNRNYLAALDASTGTATGWNPGTNEFVRALDASCDTVYVGGSFTQVGGLERDRIAAIGADSGTVASWDPSASSVVYSLISTPTQVYAGGAFTLIGSAVRYGIAALDRATGKATSWNPVAESPPIVRALALSSDGTVYAGGSFIRLGDADRSRLGAIDPTTGKATGWDPEADTPVYALAASGGELFVGGTQRQVGTAMQQGFASFGGSPGTLPPTPVYCPGHEPVQQAPPPAPAPQAVVLANTARPRLVLSSVSVKPRRFRVGKAATAISARAKAKRTPVGTFFRWVVSESSTVRIRIYRRIRGHLVGKRCGVGKAAVRSSTTTASKPCSIDRFVGVLTRQARRGKGRFRFSGRLGKKPLQPGRYDATIKAATADGRQANERVVSFEVLAR